MRPAPPFSHHSHLSAMTNIPRILPASAVDAASPCLAYHAAKEVTMRRTAAWIPFCLALALMVPASQVHASDKYTVHKDKPMDHSRRPAAGKALVYFIRSQTMGAAVKVKLYADGKFIGIISSHTYIPFECDPGKHEFVANAENAGLLEAELLPDRIYYVQVAIHMGAMKARTHFETARKNSEAMEEISKDIEDLHLVSTTDEGIKWVTEEDANIQETIKK